MQGHTRLSGDQPHQEGLGGLLHPEPGPGPGAGVRCQRGEEVRPRQPPVLCRGRPVLPTLGPVLPILGPVLPTLGPVPVPSTLGQH